MKFGNFWKKIRIFQLDYGDDIDEKWDVQVNGAISLLHMSENIQILVANDSSMPEKTVLTITKNISFVHEPSLATEKANH